MQGCVSKHYRSCLARLSLTVLEIEHLPAFTTNLIITRGFLLMSADNTHPDRKTYTSPKLNKLTPKEAHLLLESQAAQGDEAAKDLLDLLFPTKMP